MTPDKYFTQSPVEVRSAEDGTRYIFGYAALYNVRSNVLRTAKGQRFVEVILAGAFDGCDMSSVRCQFDHSEFLAAAPTLEVGADTTGLWYRYKHDPEDPSHVQMLRRINRGDCKGSSFMFPELQPEHEEVKMEAGMTIRSIRSFPKLIDVSPVISPAYSQTSVFARSLDAAYETDTERTKAQQKAGNYKKGKVTLFGMDISVECPIGYTRTGTDKNGNAWETEMTAHYGYILGTNAADSDNLDVFFTDDAEAATVAYVIDQIGENGAFYEHKVFIGPDTAEDAYNLYHENYSDGWTGFGAMTALPISVFVAWAMDGKPKKAALKYFFGMENNGEMRSTTGSDLEPTGSTSEAAGSTPEAVGTESEATGTTPELTGSEAEVSRNLNGSETEATGSQPEEPGSAPEATGSTSEPDGSESEEKEQ